MYPHVPTKFGTKRATFEYPTDLIAIFSHLAVCTAWVQNKKCNISAISQPFGAILGAFGKYRRPLIDRIGGETNDGNGGIGQSNSEISIIVTICISILHISAGKAK